MQNLKLLASLYSLAGQLESYLVANPKDSFLVMRLTFSHALVTFAGSRGSCVTQRHRTSVRIQLPRDLANVIMCDRYSSVSVWLKNVTGNAWKIVMLVCHKQLSDP